MNTQTRNKETNSSEINWQQLYVVTEHWESDLLFFEDEIRFFRDLINRYFIQLIDDLEKTRALAGKLADLETERIRLMKNVSKHKHNLSEHFSSPFILADPVCLDEHTMLEASLADFVKRFRARKRTLFEHLDDILKSEKQHHLISRK